MKWWHARAAGEHFHLFNMIRRVLFWLRWLWYILLFESTCSVCSVLCRINTISNNNIIFKAHNENFSNQNSENSFKSCAPVFFSSFFVPGLIVKPELLIHFCKNNDNGNKNAWFTFVVNSVGFECLLDWPEWEWRESEGKRVEEQKHMVVQWLTGRNSPYMKILWVILK